MPGRRVSRSGVGSDTEERLDESLDNQAATLGRGVHPAEVADAMQTGRQGVLKEPSDEGVAGQGANAGLLGAGVNVLKTHPVGSVVVVMHLTVPAKCRAKDIAGEIFESGFAGTGRLAMHDPIVAPHRRGNRGMDIRMGGTQALFNPGAKPCGERLDGQQEVGPTSAAPRAVIRSQSASGNNIVNVGMQPQGPVPRVINPEESEFSAKVPGIGSDLLESGGAFLEERIEEPVGMIPSHKPQLLRHREGHQKVRHRQQTAELAFEPDVGVGAAAARTQAVVTAVETIDFLPTLGARTAVPAHRRGATPQNRGERPALGGWQAATLADEVVRTVASEQLSQRRGHYAPSSGLTRLLIVAKALSSLTAVRWV